MLLHLLLDLTEKRDMGDEKESIRMEGLKPTDAAIAEIKRTIKDQELKDVHIRVAVGGGGCSGFQYKMVFEASDQINPELDTVDDYDGLKIVVDKKSLLFLDGTTLDWIDEGDLGRRGFDFKNPNATHTCGCGQSFGA